MKYTIYLTSSASADMIVATDYYNSKSNGLGKRMTNEVDSVLNRIATNPQVFSIRYRDILAAKVSSFPYFNRLFGDISYPSSKTHR